MAAKAAEGARAMGRSATCGVIRAGLDVFLLDPAPGLALALALYGETFFSRSTSKRKIVEISIRIVAAAVTVGEMLSRVPENISTGKV